MANTGALVGPAFGDDMRVSFDSAAGTTYHIAAAGPRSDRFAAARSFIPGIGAATDARASGWRAQIDALRSGALPEAAWEGGEAG